MILFSRVRGALRRIESREWALLTLETLGVVAGILIAFELNEWASRRSEAAKQARLMSRFLEESANDVSVLRGFRDALKPMIEREESFAVSLAKAQCPPDIQFQAVTTLTVIPAMTVPTSVYDELSAAGGLSSIERQDVRDKVAEFYTDLGWSQRQIDYFRDARVEPVAEDDPRVRIRFDPSADEPEIATFDGQALCKDQGFKNRVASATRAHTTVLSYFQGSLENAISMCVRLGDSLGNACSPSFGGPLKGDDAKYLKKVVVAMRKDKAEAR